MSSSLRKKLLLLIALVSGMVLLGYLVLCIGFSSRVAESLLRVLGIAAAAGFAGLVAVGLYLRRTMYNERKRLYFYENFTGLGSGNLLSKNFDELKDRRGYAYVLIRINGFNRLNTLFGLEIGGNTVKRLIPLLQEFTGSHEASAYRPTLDSFALLSPAPDRTVFERELSGLIEKLERICVEDKHITYSYHYTFSYGIYYLTEADRGKEQLLRISTLANAATERLAEKPESAGTVFNEENKPNWELRTLLEERVQEAWRNREFVPYYQLVYDLNRNQPVGAELLTRWNFPGRGLVMPADFLPVLEEAGLIMDLDLYMLEEACKRIKGWIDKELVTVPLSINISKLNIHRQDFVDRVIKIVDSYGIPPVLIELELSEAALLFEKNDAFFSLVNRLHSYGLSLSMDNFAANDYSSTNLLRDLPVDVIKLSRQFFRNAREGSRDRIFIKSVITMAKAMGTKIVAMGVEDADDAALFRQLGCNFAQGYFFSKPMPDETFEEQIF